MVGIKIYANRKIISDEKYHEIIETAKEIEQKKLDYNNGIIWVHKNYIDNQIPENNPLIGMVQRLYERVKIIHKESEHTVPDIMNVSGDYNELFLKYQSKYINYALTALRISKVYRNASDKTSHQLMDDYYFFNGPYDPEVKTDHSYENFEDDAIQIVLKIPDMIDFIGPQISGETGIDLADCVALEVEDDVYKTFEFTSVNRLFSTRDSFEKYMYGLESFIVYSHAGMCANVVRKSNIMSTTIQKAIKDMLDMIYTKYPDAIIEIP